MKKLTQIQKHILDTIIEITNTDQKIHSSDSLAIYLNAGKANTYQHIQKLGKKGYLRLSKNQHGLYPIMDSQGRKLKLQLVVE